VLADQGTFRRIVEFGTRETPYWDGRWTLVAFSIPETQRQLRHAVRTNLRWLWLAPLYDGSGARPGRTPAPR
jgi:phenylacetic acid degradation operon negative regulatory protein